MKDGGIENFQILADYDRTISATSSPPSFGVVRESEYVCDAFTHRLRRYLSHYYPIEKKHGISFEEKALVCEEWCEMSKRCYQEFKITSTQICGAFMDSNH